MPVARRGRPVKIARFEAEKGVQLEHYVMEGLTRGRSQAQIAASLKVSIRTLRRHLAKRGYRIVCDYKLVPIDAPRAGQSPVGPGSDRTEPPGGPA